MPGLPIHKIYYSIVALRNLQPDLLYHKFAKKFRQFRGFGGIILLGDGNYYNCCLPIIASVSILPLAYSIVLPVGSPLARRVIFTPVSFNSELI